MSNNFIDAVKAIPIPRYMLEYVSQLHPGVDYDLYVNTVCRCPVHDEATPSFRWYETTNTCVCFGCRIGGDIISLHRAVLSEETGREISFKAALASLAEIFEIDGASIAPPSDAAPVIETTARDVALFDRIVLDRAPHRLLDKAEILRSLIKSGRVTVRGALEFYEKMRSGESVNF